MMDTQRLVALAVFAFSSLLLWEAWQKHNAPKIVATPASTIPAAPTSSGNVSPPTAPSASSGTTAIPPPPAATATTAATGEPVVVKTDLFDVELNTLGGDIRRVTMKQQHSALDRTQPLTLMEPDPKHYYVTQTGLLGDGLPTHKTAYQAEQRTYSLPAGQDALEVRLKARDVNGAEV